MQARVGEDAEPFPVAYQHAAGALCLHHSGDRDNVGAAVDDMRRAQECLLNARHRQRLHFALAVTLRQRAQLVRQVRKQQCAEHRVARDQRVDSSLGKLVCHHLFGREKAAACAAGNQRASVEAVVGPIGCYQFFPVELRDMAFDDDEQVQRLGRGVEDRFTFTEVGDIDAVANNLLFSGVEAVERRGCEIERVGHDAPLSTHGDTKCYPRRRAPRVHVVPAASDWRRTRFGRWSILHAHWLMSRSP